MGQGNGKTAQELGLTNEFVHFTQDEQAFEALSFGQPGYANALSSRSQAKGEAALAGEGFYLAFGHDPYWAEIRGGFTVPYQLRADAREITDFRVIRHEQLIGGKELKALLLLNRDAVTTSATDPDPFSKTTLSEALAKLKGDKQLINLSRYAPLRAKFDAEIRGMSVSEQTKFAQLLQEITEEEVAHLDLVSRDSTAKRLELLLGMPVIAGNPIFSSVISAAEKICIAPTTSWE